MPKLPTDYRNEDDKAATPSVTDSAETLADKFVYEDVAGLTFYPAEDE